MIAYSLAYRQGEILFFKVKKYNNFYYNSLKPVANGVIREGEKEGHEHKVEGGQAELFMSDNKEEGVLKVATQTTITHPEHDSIKLPKGDYVVKVQKEATGNNSHQLVKD
jgi:hypothetical protein